MKTHKLKILTIVLTAFTAFASAPVRAQQCLDPVPLIVSGEEVVTINGIVGAMFSPLGKWTVLQSPTGFYLLPTERLDEAADDIEMSLAPFTKGYAKGFLPESEKVIFAPRRGLYALDPLTFKTDPIFQAIGEDSGDFLEHSQVIAASENLVISGDGDYTKSSGSGNILRFDTSRRTMTRAAQIIGFKKAFLSPNRKFILYDSPGGEAVGIHLYDIRGDVSTPIATRFGFKPRSPKRVIASVFPLGWITAQQFAAVVNEGLTEEYEEEESKGMKNPLSWLVSFDVVSGKIIWKRQLKEFDPAARFEKLSETKAFFDGGDGGRYEVALADGRLTELPRVAGSEFSFSPDKTRMAFAVGRQIFVSSPNGANKKLAIEVPENRQGEVVLGDDRNRIAWSPNGERLLVSNGVRTIIVKLKKIKFLPANASDEIRARPHYDEGKNSHGKPEM